MLLSIGFNVAESRLDAGDYDLLASEARLASFIAIAKRDVPARHWFRLDRRSVAMGNRDGAAVLVGLDVRVPDARARHARPGRQPARPRLIGGGAARSATTPPRAVCRGGVSESAFNTRDLDQTYQYSPFGVPALGLKRGLGQRPRGRPLRHRARGHGRSASGGRQLPRCWRLGGLGQFGFYEALDFTPERLAEGETVAVVRAYMAHHQGMTIVAIANALLGGAMQGYFHAEAAARATELLLQEKPPRSVEAAPEGSESEAREGRLPVLAGRRRLHTWRPRTPHTSSC